jgi:photosystem II stability/assembly factor-like uncharacterized protein
MGTHSFRLLLLCLAALGTPAVLVSQSAPAAGPADAREARGSIRQMQRFDRDRGLVLTDGALLFTDDGGANWADLSPRRGLAGVSELFFLEADRGWLAGVTPGAPSRLVVLDTADGGSSWREQSIETSDLSGGRFYAAAQVHFADADHGWLLGRVATGAAVSVGELLATADAGESCSACAATGRGPSRVRECGAPYVGAGQRAAVPHARRKPELAHFRFRSP